MDKPKPKRFDLDSYVERTWPTVAAEIAFQDPSASPQSHEERARVKARTSWFTLAEYAIEVLVERRETNAKIAKDNDDASAHYAARAH